MSRSIIIILICLLMNPAGLLSEIEFDLSPGDRQSLRRGDPVVRTKEVAGAPWPEVTVFSLIDAAALESCAVFYAYHEHREFLPDLLLSIPVRYISPADLHIRFEMKVPWPLKNSRYVTGNRFGRYGDGGFRISWYHVTSTSAKNTRGMVIFQPFEENTLFIYRTFIHPKSGLAGLFKKRMLREVLKSVNAIINRIESTRKLRPEKMPGYIDAVNRTLAGEYVYSGISGAEDRE